MVTALLSSQRKLFRDSRRYYRTFLRPSLERTARALAAEAIGRGSGLINISEREGYVKFSTAQLTGGSDTIQRLSALCKQWISDINRVSFGKKEFLINLMKSEDVLESPKLMDLVLDKEIISSVARYFGQVPRLYHLNMWWSRPNQTQKESQFFHYDHRDSRQAKVFINVSDVTESSGPLHFVPAGDCLKVDNIIGYSSKRYTDEEVYSCVSPSDVVVATGDTGSAYIVDTARCLHYGSRGNTLDRLILMASFARANSVEPGGGCRVLDPIRSRLAEELYATDPVSSFVLTAPR